MDAHCFIILCMIDLYKDNHVHACVRAWVCAFVNFFFNPFPYKPWFLRVCNKSLLKTLWEKEKLLITTNFSFSHSVFYPVGELSAIFIRFEIVSC